MKAVGIVRKLKDNGRLVIPVELRRQFDIDDNDAIEIFADEKGIFLRKYEMACTFCGSSNNVTDFGNKNICDGCRSKIEAL